jgi:hypothetical protein
LKEARFVSFHCSDWQNKVRWYLKYTTEKGPANATNFGASQLTKQVSLMCNSKRFRRLEKRSKGRDALGEREDSKWP